jgi:ABC-type transport system involved in multi-copper enzyme maturation permease subunit
MELWREILEFARIELRRTLTSTKGLALLLLYGLAQSAGGLLFAAMQHSPAGQMIWALLLKAMSPGSGTEADFKFLQQIPPTSLFAYWFTLFVVPVLVLLMGFDQLSGELASRSVRYVAFRSRRISWALGKAMAQAGSLFALSLLSSIVVLIFGAIFNTEFSLIAAIEWTLLLWLLSSAYGLCYVGLTSFVSACFRNPFLSLVAGVSALFGMWIVGVLGRVFDSLHPLRYLLPGSYTDSLLSPEPSKTFLTLGVFVLFAAAFLAASVGVLRARDL